MPKTTQFCMDRRADVLYSFLMTGEKSQLELMALCGLTKDSMRQTVDHATYRFPLYERKEGKDIIYGIL